MEEPVDVAAKMAGLSEENGEAPAASDTKFDSAEGEVEVAMEVEGAPAATTRNVNSVVSGLSTSIDVPASGSASAAKDKLIMGLENAEGAADFQAFFKKSSVSSKKEVQLSEEKRDDNDGVEKPEAKDIEPEEPVTFWTMPSNILKKCPVIFKPTGDDEESGRLAKVRQQEFSTWGGKMEWVVIEEVDIEVEERVKVAIPAEEAKGTSSMEETKMDTEAEAQPPSDNLVETDAATPADEEAKATDAEEEVSSKSVGQNGDATQVGIAAPPDAAEMETTAVVSGAECGEAAKDSSVALSETAASENVEKDAAMAAAETEVAVVGEQTAGAETNVPAAPDTDQTNAPETDVTAAPKTDPTSAPEPDVAAAPQAESASAPEADPAAASEMKAAADGSAENADTKIAAVEEASGAASAASPTIDASQTGAVGAAENPEVQTTSEGALLNAAQSDVAAVDDTAATGDNHHEETSANDGVPSSPVSRTLRRRTKISTYNISKLMEANTMPHLNENELAAVEAKKASKPKFKFIMQKKIVKETRIRPATEADFLHNLHNIRIQVSFTNANPGQRKVAKKGEKLKKRSSTSTSASSSPKKKKKIIGTATSSATSSSANKKKNLSSVSTAPAKSKKGTTTPRSTSTTRSTTTPKSNRSTGTARSARSSSSKSTKKKASLPAEEPTKTLPARKAKSPAKHKLVAPAPAASANKKKKVSTLVPTALPTKMELSSMRAPEPELRQYKGWIRKEFLRQNGSTAGTTDKYWISPKPHHFKFRSMLQVRRYLECLEETKGDEEKAYDKFRQG